MLTYFFSCLGSASVPVFVLIVECRLSKPGLEIAGCDVSENVDDRVTIGLDAAVFAFEARPYLMNEVSHGHTSE